MRAWKLMALVLAAMSAHGQAPLEEIVVEGRALDRAAGGTASVSEVDADALDLIRPTHVSEALARLPGVWISRGSGQEHLTAIRSAVLTGAGACGAFLYLEDGVPIRPAGLCNINNLFELNTEQAAAIEVWRGPGSAVLGGNGLLGAVNVRTALPERHRVSLEGGPYGYGQGRLAVRGDLGDFAVGLAAHATRSNGYRDSTGYEQYKGNLIAQGEVAGWQLRSVVSATVLHQETGGFVLGQDAFRDSSLRGSNPNPEAYRDAWAVRWTVDLQRDGWRVTPYARRSSMRFIQHFLPGQPVEDNGQSSFGVMFSQTLGQAFGPDALNASWGGQVEHFSGTLEQFQAGPTVGSAFLVATRPPGLHYDYEVDGLSAAVHYDLSYALAEHVELTHSARLESVEYRYDNRTIDGNTRDDGSVCGFGGCLYTRPSDRDDRFTDVAGRLGLSYRPGGGALELYALLATGFRPPQATELYRLQSGQTVADIDSEAVRALELGLRRGGVELAVFSQRVRNQILRDAQGFNVSDGRTRSEGLEASLGYGGERSRLHLAVTWARHRYDFSSDPGRREVITSGNDVDTAPRLLANLRWRYAWSERLSQEIEVAYTDHYYMNAENTQRYDGHTVVNWRGRWQPNERLSLHARLINLLDRKYADRADFAFGNPRYFPAMPRQLYVGVEYAF